MGWFMKKIIFTILISLCMASFVFASSNTWTSQSDFDAGSGSYIDTSISSGNILIKGYDDSFDGTSVDTAERWNPSGFQDCLTVNNQLIYSWNNPAAGHNASMIYTKQKIFSGGLRAGPRQETKSFYDDTFRTDG